MKKRYIFLLTGIFVIMAFVNIQAQEPPPPSQAEYTRFVPTPEQEQEVKVRKTKRIGEIFMPTPEQEQEALNFVKQFDPQVVEHLRDLKVEQPDRYMREITRLIRDKVRLERLKKRSPERYEQAFKIRSMEAQSEILGRHFRDANESEKAKIKTELKSLLTELFDLRNLDRQEEVKRLEKQLAELKQSITEREKNKAMIVERRLMQLIGEKSYLEW